MSNRKQNGVRVTVDCEQGSGWVGGVCVIGCGRGWVGVGRRGCGWREGEGGGGERRVRSPESEHPATPAPPSPRQPTVVGHGGAQKNLTRATSACRGTDQRNFKRLKRQPKNVHHLVDELGLRNLYHPTELGDHRDLPLRHNGGVDNLKKNGTHCPDHAGPNRP